MSLEVVVSSLEGLYFWLKTYLAFHLKMHENTILKYMLF